MLLVRRFCDAAVSSDGLPRSYEVADGVADCTDPGCSGQTCSVSMDKATSITATFTSRSAPTECADERDNDGDGQPDLPGCQAGDTEAPPPSPCRPRLPTRSSPDDDRVLDGAERFLVPAPERLGDVV